jgi:O-antigen ligase
MALNDLLLVLGIIVGGVLAITGLFRPFIGLLVLMTLHFVQPGEMVPALAPFRIELVYGILMLLNLFRTRAAALSAAFQTNPIVRATVMLEGLILLTVPFAMWRGGAFASATELGKMIILQLLMTVFIDSVVRLRQILYLLVSFLAWFVGSSYISYLNGQYYVVNGVERAQGVNSMVGGPNELAGLLLALLPFLVALIRCTKNFFAKLLFLSLGGLSLFVLLLTGARISLLALLALGVFYIFESRHKLVTLVAVLALSATLWFSLPAQYQKRFLTVKQYAQGGELDDSNKLRLAVWDAGWRMFLDHPILGVGAGQFATAYGLVYSGKAHTAWMQPHNLFLQVTCELGLVGLCIFVYFVFQIWKANREVLRMRGSPGLEINYHFAVACSFMLIGVALISMVSHTLYRPYWYLLAGLVASNTNIARNFLRDKSQAEAEEPDPDEVELKEHTLYGDTWRRAT